MDMQMPILDGLEATRALRALGGTCAHVPVTVLTANAFDEDRSACQAAGMTDFLSKPVSPDELESALARVTAREPESRAGPFRPRASLLQMDDRRRTMLVDQLGEQAYVALLAEFRGELRVMLASFEQCLARSDTRGLERILHNLKGAAANLGFGLLASRCGTLQETVRALGPSSLRQLVGDLGADLERPWPADPSAAPVRPSQPGAGASHFYRPVDGRQVQATYGVSGRTMANS